MRKTTIESLCMWFYVCTDDCNYCNYCVITASSGMRPYFVAHGDITKGPTAIRFHCSAGGTVFCTWYIEALNLWLLVIISIFNEHNIFVLDFIWVPVCLSYGFLILFYFTRTPTTMFYFSFISHVHASRLIFQHDKNLETTLKRWKMCFRVLFQFNFAYASRLRHDGFL